MIGQELLGSRDPPTPVGELDRRRRARVGRPGDPREEALGGLCGWAHRQPVDAQVLLVSLKGGPELLGELTRVGLVLL